MAALGRVARTVKLGGLLDLLRVRKVFAEAFAERRAEVATKIDAGDVHIHFMEDLFQCIQDAGGGIDQGPVHVE